MLNFPVVLPVIIFIKLLLIKTQLEKLLKRTPPIINIVAMTFGYLIGGAVLVEVVFSWPGIGTYAVQAMDFSDYDPDLGVVLLSATIYVVVYFLVDLLQFLLDPRLRE